ncbi:MAG: EAL domain-containing protein [Zhongshania sp.]|uniref:EAL domain-containing protein n=1 Tax=Zhongshania sp. TaxID=1971902 RepID=UPI002626607C|nr:EAL domain-containing protein [Zhongshania sp.]MDF1690865.1 EAL domain-containing protein [Zhongshania sp.]
MMVQVQYFPYFQPIIDINRMAIMGYEALARTRDKNDRVASIGALFSDPDFDRRELLTIDRSVREQALAYFAKSQHDVFLSLNLSPEWMDHIGDDTPVPTIAMTHKWGVDPSRILIEFVEGAGNNDNMQKLLARYRAEGMRIAIDDFGAGSSHLDRIIALEPDIIKLDMNLFKRAMAGGISQEVVQSIAHLARRTGSELLCEGVETEQEFYFALECGARYVQGYFFWPALPEFIDPDSPKEIIRLLLEGFVKRNLNREKQLMQYMQEMEHYFLSVQSALKDTELNYNSLHQAPHGFARVFVCRHNGIQISPNYELSHHAEDQCIWQVDDSNRGSNWSMRPYFYQALAAKELQHKNQVASQPYRDVRSGRMCQTIGKVLSNDRILFAAILCLDDDDSDRQGNGFYRR